MQVRLGHLFDEEYVKTARQFLSKDQNMIMITSWNEWHEDTQIEPSAETILTTVDVSLDSFYTVGFPHEGYGFSFLEVTKELLPSRSQTTSIITDSASMRDLDRSIFQILQLI